MEERQLADGYSELKSQWIKNSTVINALELEIARLERANKQYVELLFTTENRVIELQKGDS